MDTTTNVKTLLQNIYNKVGYFDMYGGSIVATMFILFVFFILLSYFYVMANIKPIKANWSTQKCSPSVIPFAGFINKPPHTSTFDYTSENFYECVNSILTHITGDFFEPIYYVMNTVHSSMQSISQDIQNVRRKISSMVGNLVSIDNEIMGRILAFMSPIRLMIVKIKDSLSKIAGVGVTSMYSVVGLWLSLQTFIRVFIQLMLDGLYTMIGMIVLLWILPFTWEIAAVYTGFFVVAASLLGIVVAGTEEIVQSGVKIPKSPMCFDENTPIQLEDGSFLPIKEVNVNMKLYDGSTVTALFKVSQNNMPMYMYKGTIVSGNHNVYYNHKWRPVSNIYGSEKVFEYNKPYLYCINTTSKKIILNGIIYSDWDDIDTDELIILRKFMHRKFGIQLHFKNMHEHLEGGFTGDTLIELNNGIQVPLKDVNINDVLSLGNTVLGIVKISSDNIDVQRCTLNHYDFYGGPNNIVNDSDLGIFSTLDTISIHLSPRKKPKYLYHLITSNGIVYVNGVLFKDYNGCVEYFLEKAKDLQD